ncbi:MAG: PilZ domain-containing protein [Candidatus Methylomirabilales bacterium]
MEKKRIERRYPRFVVGGRAKGRITAVYEASLVNISLCGALIEHAHVVRPGTVSYLVLILQGREVNVRCRVVRSVVHRPQVLPDGGRELIYHTGIEFLDPSDETQQMLSDFIDTLKEN